MDGEDLQALVDLLAGRPSDLQLDRAALELARIEYPDLNTEAYISRLDQYASAVADRAQDLSDGADFVATTSAYLFEELGFAGNDKDYYLADNSYLNRVMDSGLGIPLTLSVIYLEVARRLARPVRGIGLPGHFLVQYDDGEYSCFIDPFHGGAVLDGEGCRRLAQTDSLDSAMLKPVDRQSIVLRMLNNLRHVYFSTGQPQKALRVLDLLIAADPEGAEEHKQRAVALQELRRISESSTAFRRYLELVPNAPDREAILDQIKNQVQWLASRN